MKIQSIDLQNFRNYPELHLDFEDGIHIFYGDNAQGKTNLLEAIYLSSACRSFRTVNDREMIRFHEEEGHVKLFFERQKIRHRIDVHLKKGRAKGVAIDSVPMRKAAEFIGFLNVILFSPEDLQIVKEGPGERRRFLDTEISLTDKIYYQAWLKYRKALEQRNQLLKDIPFTPSLTETLDVWDEALIRAGKEIIAGRKQFVSDMFGIVREMHRTITGDKEILEIRYEPDVNEEDFAEKLRAARERDLRQKTTTVGPHRDDLAFDLVSLKKEEPVLDARIYGSQGQQRTAALSLKLSEIEWIRKKAGEPPVLLLDDVLSELDSGRQEYLLNSLKGIQTFITCTGLEHFVRNRVKTERVYHVTDGVITNDERI